MSCIPPNTDLGADIPNSHYKQILINLFPSDLIWAAGKVIAYKAAAVSEVTVNLTNTFFLYYGFNALTSTPTTTTATPAAITKTIYDITALMAKIGNFIKCKLCELKVVCENKPYYGKKGHMVKKCFTYGGGLSGKYLDWWKGLQNIHLQPNFWPQQRRILLSLRIQESTIHFGHPKIQESRL
jgi:hypothetical protein